jgi:hypothetical protein
MLYAFSALTFVLLSLGAPPLAVASALVAAVGRLDRALGVQVRLLDRATDALLRLLDDRRSREVRAYLDAIKEDQGAMVQLTPEAMELFDAAVRDRPGVFYQCTVAMAPPPSPTDLALRAIGRPWSALSPTLFATLYGITMRHHERYPCVGPPNAAADAAVLRAFGTAPPLRANDGVVPLRSQVWGEVAWAGFADHLDVLGHFMDDEGGDHIDWMRSGSDFGRARFAQMMDAIAAGMLRAVKA